MLAARSSEGSFSGLISSFHQQSAFEPSLVLVGGGPASVMNP